jgi:tRNA pseudouridine13 synthase
MISYDVMRYDTIFIPVSILTYSLFSIVYSIPQLLFIYLFEYDTLVDDNQIAARLTSLEDNLAPPPPPKEIKDETMDGATEGKKRSAEDADVNVKVEESKDEKTNESEESSTKKPRIDDDDTKMTSVKSENTDVSVNTNTSTSTSTDEKQNKDETMAQLKEKLEKLLGSESTKSMMEMLERWETAKATTVGSKEKPFPPRKGVEDETKYVTLPLIEDKTVRKEIHLLIKSDLMKHMAMADTVDKKVRVWHKLFERQMPNYKKFGTNSERPRKEREVWPEDRPNYLRFVMYKENIDTSTAVKDIARIARINPRGPRNMRGVSGGVTYAGMKDKRGVTTQYCTVFRKTPTALMVMNRNRKNKKGGGNTNNNGQGIMRVGCFSYVHKELRLGMLKGNRFDIVLRNVCIDKRSEMAKGEVIKLTTEKLRESAKSMKEIGFINFFGMQRFGKFHDTHLVGIAVLKGDFKQACELIMRAKPGEQERYKILRSKWENRFNDIDLKDEKAADDAEMNCANEMLKGLGRFMNCETSIAHSLSRKPRDYKKAFGCIAKHMRSMFLHAYQSYLWNKAASHRIEKGGGASEVMEGDLVLTENKTLKEGGNGTSGLKGKQVMIVSQDDIETGKYKMKDVVLPLVGTRVDLPTNSTGDLFEEMLEEDGLTLQSFQKIQDRELSLGGDYRKMICNPSDVDFEIKLYKDPLQPLIKTDLMRINGEELQCEDVTDPDSSTSNDEDKVLVAMVIGFTLPPSAYATIALRELMKRPTSTEYQTLLKLEGDCEGGINSATALKNEES